MTFKTKPGFVKKRIIALFNSSDTLEQSAFVMAYNKNMEQKLTVKEFKEQLPYIPEEILINNLDILG